MALCLTVPLSPSLRLHCVTEIWRLHFYPVTMTTDGLIFLWPRGWWNSKQTFFLRRRRVLHHSGWGRHRRLCCVAITGGYGIQYTWPPPLNTEGLCSTLQFLSCRFLHFTTLTPLHKAFYIWWVKRFFLKILQSRLYFSSVMSLFSICM